VNSFKVEAASAGQTLAAILRAQLSLTWSAARALCERGKVFVDEVRTLDSALRPAVGAQLVVRHEAPRPLSERSVQALAAIVYEDSQVVVIDKPAGIISVPYERDDTNTAMDLIRAAWRAQGRRAADVTSVALHVVHRIDKETSGLLLFAKTKGALRELQARFRQHDIERRYLCVVHGRVTDRRIESHLIDDRGDGLRGSFRLVPGTRGSSRPQGKRAVTHVKAVEAIGSSIVPIATLCAVTLETGKTHQIRIHLSEAGHPIVGEQVYIRDFVNREMRPLPSTRLLLHAETLGFVHPVSGEQIALSRPPPAEFSAALGLLRALAARNAPPESPRDSAR
jgi:23S rRNA pseudouridine1911/1915/1917 synthase